MDNQPGKWINAPAGTSSQAEPFYGLIWLHLAHTLTNRLSSFPRVWNIKWNDADDNNSTIGRGRQVHTVIDLFVEQG
jgi:hypothetical protein